MAVVAAGTAGAAHIADELALADALARTDGQGQAVRIDRGVAAGVADDDRVAVAGARARLIVARLGNGAAGGGVDGRARRGADIHALVAAAVPARAVAVVGYRPDELAAAGDVLGFVGHLLGADDDLLVHGLLDGLGREDRLLQQGAVGIINILQRHESDAVLALLQGLGGTLGVLVGLGGLGAEGDLLLPRLHLGDADFQQSLLLRHRWKQYNE